MMAMEGKALMHPRERPLDLRPFSLRPDSSCQKKGSWTETEAETSELGAYLAIFICGVY